MVYPFAHLPSAAADVAACNYATESRFLPSQKKNFPVRSLTATCGDHIGPEPPDRVIDPAPSLLFS
jgi:hypothetical protein